MRAEWAGREKRSSGHWELITLRHTKGWRTAPDGSLPKTTRPRIKWVERCVPQLSNDWFDLGEAVPSAPRWWGINVSEHNGGAREGPGRPSNWWQARYGVDPRVPASSWHILKASSLGLVMGSSDEESQALVAQHSDTYSQMPLKQLKKKSGTMIIIHPIYYPPQHPKMEEKQQQKQGQGLSTQRLMIQSMD